VSSQPTRKLAFTKQPRNTPDGQPIPGLQVAVLDAAGNVDASFRGNISIEIDNQPIPLNLLLSRPENSTPYRLRAKADGCEDAVSDVFYILHKPEQTAKFTIGDRPKA
jgi:hypothetical protein